MIVTAQLGLRGGRPAWSTAVGLGPIPYRFAGSNPAPRITFLQSLSDFSAPIKMSKLCYLFEPTQNTLPLLSNGRHRSNLGPLESHIFAGRFHILLPSRHQ